MPTSPLHIKLGLVNLLLDLLFQRSPNLEQTIADRAGVVRKEYHGGAYEGRQCSKLLACSDVLQAIVPPEDYPIVECLRHLHDVNVGIFGNSLVPDWRHVLEGFRSSFMDVVRQYRISVTSKAHILMDHVPLYVQTTGLPLGPSSEEVVESQHHHFDVFYTRFKVCCTNSTLYGQKLLDCMLHYNANHI